MKKITTILAALLLASSSFAQAPQKMTYQAVVRNSSNALVQSSPVGMKVSILQGRATGTAVYVETHTAQTNQNGLLDIVIGGGTIVSGTYVNGVFWAGGPYFLKTEIDPLGGTAYTITSTSELLSVPFSNYSHVSGILTGWATDFVGVYTVPSPPSSFTFDNFIITYLSSDKVQILINGNILRGGVYGTVSGNTLVIPTNNSLMIPCVPNACGGTGPLSISGSGIRNGNNLSLTLTMGGAGQCIDPAETYTFELVRQ